MQEGTQEGTQEHADADGVTRLLDLYPHVHT